MAGIYIHIPFCASRCIYCGFYSTTRHELRQRYIDAVCKEWSMRRNYLKAPTETIYIGGGTPSQLEGEQLRQLFATIGTASEVTIECNPDDITPDFALMLSSLPINRVSMGAQTFNDARLRFLHRRHTSDQVRLVVDNLRQMGIANISLDLMCGFPGQTLSDWHQDIDAALALEVEHLSAYSLMYEEETPLHRMLEQGKIQEIDEELALKMYDDLVLRLEEAGYEHYEISNFAKPGYRSRHNSSYWHEVPYIGLGAAAHSYDGKSRQWNVDDVEQYIAGIEEGCPKTEYELLDEDTRYNELIMTALRTCEGLRLNRLDADYRHYCLSLAQRYLDDGLLVLNDGHLRLTRRGIAVSNLVMSGLMK